MLTIIGGWIATKGVSLLLGYAANFLLSIYLESQKAEALREQGRAEEAAEALARQSAEQAEAAQVRAEAEAEHAKRPDSDNGFDKDFMRP